MLCKETVVLHLLRFSYGKRTFNSFAQHAAICHTGLKLIPKKKMTK